MSDRPRISPEPFAREYLAAIGRAASWIDYQHDIDWTPTAIEAGESACTNLKLRPSREYLRLDVMGYWRRGRRNDWDLCVAMEHENRDNWDDELCKLSHVVADLRVIVSYHDFSCANKLVGVIGDRVTRMKDRMHLVPESEWLFVFGPRVRSVKKGHVHYECFTMRDKQVVPIDSCNRLLDVSKFRDFSATL